MATTLQSIGFVDLVPERGRAVAESSPQKIMQLNYRRDTTTTWAGCLLLRDQHLQSLQTQVEDGRHGWSISSYSVYANHPLVQTGPEGHDKSGLAENSANSARGASVPVNAAFLQRFLTA